MLKSQKTMLVISERRQNQTELAEKVNASADGATEEQINQRSALAKDIATLETEYRGHLTDEAAEETRAFGDAEARERRALVAGCNIGAIFAATIDHRQTDGQVAELQESLNLAANQVPLELLETRAVTPAPGEVQASQAAIEPYVSRARSLNFWRSRARRSGLENRSTRPSSAPRLSTRQLRAVLRAKQPANSRRKNFRPRVCKRAFSTVARTLRRLSAWPIRCAAP